MKKISLLSSALLLAMTMFFVGCDKSKEYDIITPPAQAHFSGAAIQTYSILTATQPVYNVVVGTTDVAAADRVVTYKVIPRTAVPGTHYTISTGNTTGTVTIKAGQATANIPVQGIFAPYNATGRKDTIVFALSEPSVPTAKFMDTVRLVLRGPCFEGDVTMSLFTGAWKAIEVFAPNPPYGPYATTISSSTLTSPTTGTIIVTNIWNNGWGPLTFNLDWTDPNNRTATVVPQAAIPGSNAGDLSATYAGQTIAVRPFPTPIVGTNTGTFSACNNTFTLRMQLGVTGVGYFTNIYTVNLTR